MRWRNLLILSKLALLGSFFVWMSVSAASELGSHAPDEQAIRATTKEYLVALERGDAKALAKFWVADGDIVDELGNSHAAYDLFTQETKSAPERPRPQVKVTSSSIRFLTADVAVEDGTSEVIPPPGDTLPSAQGRFTAMWVKQEGKWRLASLREARVEPPATAAQLADLDGMAGEWSAQDGQAAFEVSAAWNPTRTFFLRELKILSEGQVAFSVMQRIGWDPLTRKIKSWNFDSDGGYGEGTWKKAAANSWIVRATGVLPDGRQTSTTNVYKFDGEDSFTWKSTSVRVDAEAPPELNIKFVRKTAGK
jgi:uncharacterized protein (TIGR02246 family)